MVRYFFLMTSIFPSDLIPAQDSSTINSTLRWDLTTTIAYARKHNIPAKYRAAQRTVIGAGSGVFAISKIAISSVMQRKR